MNKRLLRRSARVLPYWRYRLPRCSRLLLHCRPGQRHDCHRWRERLFGEVEAVLYEHPSVREAAVIGIRDPKWGELVTACVVLKLGMIATAEELMSHCRRSLANYKVPRRVEFMPSDLPKNGSGKVMKRALRQQFSTHDYERALAVG